MATTTTDKIMKNISSNVRAPLLTYYWAVSRNIYDVRPVYKVLERGDIFDQQNWDEGRYFLSEEDAREYVKKRRQDRWQRIMAKAEIKK